jgi:hypothetical protein
MIVGTLKSNIQLSVSLMLILSIGLWAGLVLQTSSVLPVANFKDHIFYTYIFDNDLPLFLNQCFALLIVLAGAVMINILTIEQEISSKTNYVTSFLYVLFSFSSSSINQIQPVLVANLFVLIGLYYLLNSYRKDKVLNECFKVGLFFALATFFCIQYVFIFPLGFIALSIMRSFNWREWAVLLFGYLTPIYIYISINYLTVNSPEQALNMLNSLLSEFSRPIISEYYMLFIFSSFLILMFTVFYYLNKGFGGKIKTQKSKYIIIWLLLFCVIMMFFKQMSDMIFITCIIPLSILLGDYLSLIKQLKIANTLVFLLMAGFTVIYLHLLGFI